MDRLGSALNTGTTPEVRGGSRAGSVGMVGALVSLLVILAAAQIADLVEFLLPERGEVSSRGTAFRHFDEIGAQLIRRIGVVMLLAAVTQIVVGRVRWVPGSPSTRLRRVAPLVLMLAGALWYGWLAKPHNGFPTNARIHWVDFETTRVDDFVYAAGRLPHWLFYESPYVW
ncbi:MAG: hypothetical protein VW060_08435, partial [Acidimicrobiaceae bacterium]